MTALWIVLAVVAVIVIYCVATVNGFRAKEIKVNESLGGIEVALTKRYDTLTKLMASASGYMTHEKELFSQVVSLRHGMTVGEMNQADKKIQEMSGRLFAVAENYPELRSSQVFMDLQAGIRDAEDQLQAARRVYNANVTRYNTSIAVFPASLLAGKRQPKEFFEAEESKREDVEIRFS